LGIYWSIQTKQAWEAALERGYLVGDPKYIWEGFIEPYHWMMEQMKKRIKGYQGEYPVWVWIKKPDLRRTAHLPPKTEGVRLKIEKPDDQVLLSDFDAWHFVLNNSFFSLNEEEDKLFESGALPMTKEESWERIFDFNLPRDPEWVGEVERIQGTTGKISIEQVKSVQFFIAR
jgi:hypothetical protein